MRWVSLHSHSTFSYGDGYGPVSYHVDTVADNGMTALALTEHGNVSSWVQLEKECKRREIRPIFGCEIYTGIPNQPRKNHMILLASNEIGLRNLNRIVTESWKTLGTTSKSKFPTVYWPQIVRYNEGLIALSGCSDSALSCVLLGGKFHGEKRMELRDTDFAAGVRLIQRYQDVFGERIFIEVQRFPLLERTCLLNQTKERLAAVTGTLLAGTADVHYPKATDQPMQKILHGAHRGGTIDTVEQGWEWGVQLTYPMSDDEIVSDLIKTGLSTTAAIKAMANTSAIAERCNVSLPKAPPPSYVMGEKDWQPW